MATVQKITLHAIAEKTKRLDYKAYVRKDGSALFSDLLEAGQTLSPEEFNGAFGEYGHFAPEGILKFEVLEIIKSNSMEKMTLTATLIGPVAISKTVYLGSGGYYSPEVTVPFKLNTTLVPSASDLEQLQEFFETPPPKGIQSFSITSSRESDK